MGGVALLGTEYLLWHYSRGIRVIFNLARNIILFIAHFFSISYLFSTLFSPWRALHETHNSSSGLDVGGTLSRWVVNILMSIVGFIVRLSFILVGTVSIIISAVAIPVVFIVWLLIPLIIPTLLLASFLQFLT